MIADPHYTVMPPAAVDLIVTDIGEFTHDSDGTVDLSPCVAHVTTAADEIRKVLWPHESPLPVWNLPSGVAAGAKLLATDIDGSITNGAKLSLAALRAFQELEERGIKIVLITGRSAAWAAALAHYLPGVSAAIAENGAVLIDCVKADATPVLLDSWDEETHAARMEKVEACLEEVLRRHPELTVSKDNFTRLTDRTLQVEQGVEPGTIAEIAAEYGIGFTYSTVHYHLSGSELDKASGLDRAMRDHLGMTALVPSTDVVTLGDSFNDAPLFGSEKFAATIGVRGVLEHLETLGEQRPQYVTLGNSSEGFVELAATLLES